MAAQDQINIKKIQFVEEIKPGYYLIVETPEGTRLIDYTNFVVGQDNITFDPLLSAFDTDIRNLSAQVIAQDAVNLATFTSLSAQTLALFSVASAANSSLTVSMTAAQADIDVLQETTDTLVVQVASLSADVISSLDSIDSNTVDIASLAAKLTQISLLSASWNSVYTTVHANSGGW